ncbi:hypothetical protein IE81DRAFT_101506 [Ceraceosorus guamensis]|uniref:Uncharacterized protein n=1 Tax=Ceraceosorus guamensis TaxID=1522189 RepID=A0A316VZM4_9BASI|nr:hypothetical protein IE81DRAFT_101506 [Ceraceosorus guamensis]PWN43036.1 hypothetical protein IE81DRAFT_101506 [Ceraceosorus guamensis]
MLLTCAGRRVLNPHCAGANGYKSKAIIITEFRLKAGIHESVRMVNVCSRREFKRCVLIKLWVATLSASSCCSSSRSLAGQTSSSSRGSLRVRACRCASCMPCTQACKSYALAHKAHRPCALARTHHHRATVSATRRCVHGARAEPLRLAWFA